MRELQPRDWRVVSDVVNAYRNHPDKPDEVFAAFMAAAFRGEIPWQLDLDGKPTGFGREGRLRSSSVSLLLAAMAETASTPAEVAAVFRAMDYAAANNFRSATGPAGTALINRAEGLRGAKPLPAGWKTAAENALTSGLSGAFWARHLLDADRLRQHGEGGIEGIA